MSGTQETIFIVKKALIVRDSLGLITGFEKEVDVRARYARAKAREDVAKGNKSKTRKFDYRYVRLKLS